MAEKSIIIRNLSYHIDEEPLFQNVNISIQASDRLAIVGRNGAGKTTFLRTLIKELDASDGSIEYSGNISFTYVEQLHKHGTHTVFEELESSFHRLQEIAAQMRVLEEAMSEGDLAEQTLETYGTLQDQFTSLGGYTYHNDIHQVLMGLNVPREQWEQPINTLSGGERTKINLGKVLLEAPDIIILDEPTNFLDMDALEWLEYFLNKKWKKGLIVVSHDRQFLDKVTTATLEMIPGRSPEYYPFSYSKYSKEREHRINIMLKHYEKQEDELLRQEEIIRRLRAGSRASLAQSRIKMLDKVERLERPPVEHTPVITFKKTEDSSDTLYTLQDMFIGYSEDEPLYYINHIQLRKGQRVGLLGPNGAGKSTLLKTIINEQDPLSGHVLQGKNITLGYYSQTLSSLNPEQSILDEMLAFATGFTREQIRSYMGKFLFYGDDIFKIINTLSGGERARVALAKLSLTPTNVLVMDEPTNHLDYVAREALEDALLRYHGTILFISHDRYFIDKIASHLWVIDPDKEELTQHSGNYSYYIEQKSKGVFRFASDAQEQNELLISELNKHESIEEIEHIKKKWKNKKRK